MTSPLNVTYVDLVGPPVSAAWLNAVSRACGGIAPDNPPTTILATAGQTVFTFPNGPSNLVFVDGVYQIPGQSFTWSSTTLTFSEGLHYHAKVTVL